MRAGKRHGAGIIILGSQQPFSPDALGSHIDVEYLYKRTALKKHLANDPSLLLK